jgi:putative zinc finger protein
MSAREMRCTEAKALFSPYLDGAVTGRQMLGVEQHLAGCATCRQEYQLLRETQRMLVSVGRPKAPEDLGLKLRLAISREAAHARQPLQGPLVRLENALNAFMVPAAAGFLASLVIFGVVMAFFYVPTLQANSQDVPLVMVNQEPELQQSSFGMNPINDDSLVIEAYIDANGRVQDYRILSDPDNSKELAPQQKSMLIDFMTFTTFRPALSMGKPTPGRAVLSFSKISVRG